MQLKERFSQYIQDLQDTICDALEELDGKATFQEDQWERPGGGGGRSRIIENGNIFEKGGVNTSVVHGELPNLMKQKFGVTEANFFACGISLVMHPHNPFIPTTHANWRYFEMYDESGKKIDAWFGGGLDLTPYYIDEEDGKHWHQVCKTACDNHHPDFYPNYKTWCDEYFFNAHRNEGRGIGGLFFDYLKDGTEGLNHEQWYSFVTEVGNSFLPAYTPIVEKHKAQPYTDQERYWQEIRRGRYVEFNLIHDRGTLFGLKTNGRMESILMSLPPRVRWDYDFQPVGMEEQKLIETLVTPRDWV